MIAVFTAQDVGHQRGPHKALWNGAAWHLGLHDRLATGAGQTQAGDLVYDVVAGLLEDDSLDHFLTCLTIFQLFHYIASQFFKAAIAVDAGVTGCDGILNALEVFRKGLAPARCAERLCIFNLRWHIFGSGLSSLFNGTVGSAGFLCEGYAYLRVGTAGMLPSHARQARVMQACINYCWGVL